MPLFHFHLGDHGSEPDLEGTEYADIAAARIAAITFAGAYLKDDPGLIDGNREFCVKVADQKGSSLFIVRIGLAEYPAN